MSKSLSQQLIVLVMLVAFLGQAAVAGTVHCVRSAAMSLSIQTTISSENAEQEHCAMSMAQHSKMVDQQISSDEGTSHCCDNPQCKCPTASHSFTTLLFGMTTVNVSVNTDMETFPAPHQHPIAVITSRYRPPIFA